MVTPYWHPGQDLASLGYSYPIASRTGRHAAFQAGRKLAIIPRQSTLDGAPVKLTSHEFRVLSYLMHHGGRVVSQAEIIEHIYAQDFDWEAHARDSRCRLRTWSDGIYRPASER
jgi:DNA-binding response OmpR family regulator